MLLKPFLLAMMIGFSSIAAPAAKEVVDTVTLEKATFQGYRGTVQLQDGAQIAQIRAYLAGPREAVHYNSPPTGGDHLGILIMEDGVEKSYSLLTPNIIRETVTTDTLTWYQVPEEFYNYLDSFFPAE